jgi:hypothetical protein
LIFELRYFLPKTARQGGYLLFSPVYKANSSLVNNLSEETLDSFACGCSCFVVESVGGFADDAGGSK